jgi:hypothetical protein
MVAWEGLIMAYHHCVTSFMAGLPAVPGRFDEEVMACSV